MNTSSKDKLAGADSTRPATAEQRLRQLGIKLPTPPEPFGIYAEAVQTGTLLFLTGMLPTVGREAKFIGRIGAELDVQTGREAAYLAAINALAVARQHLGSLDKVTRIVRLGVMVATEFMKMVIPADSIARAVAYAIEQPANVEIEHLKNPNDRRIERSNGRFECGRDLLLIDHFSLPQRRVSQGGRHRRAVGNWTGPQF